MRVVYEHEESLMSMVKDLGVEGERVSLDMRRLAFDGKNIHV